jgi:uncharacterized metal-binding protein YceD (DUF177 family)
MSTEPTFPCVTPDSIPPHGLTVSLGPWAVAACVEGIDGELEKLEGKLKVTRHGVHLVVRGDLGAQVRLHCDRCRVLHALDISGRLDCLYSPVSTIPVREEDEEGDFPMPIELPEPVTDQGEYDGVSLDLRDVVREFFALERPPAVRCVDFNPASDVECMARWRSLAGPLDDGAATDHPFAALAGFKPTR